MTDDSPRTFTLRFRSVKMSERRMMASKFGVNFDAIEADLADLPRAADPENPTDAEKVATYQAFVRVVGPNERFALLYAAVKREIPAATEQTIEAKADSGEWVLDLGFREDDESAPLPETTTEQS